MQLTSKVVKKGHESDRVSLTPFKLQISDLITIAFNRGMFYTANQFLEKDIIFCRLLSYYCQTSNISTP